MWIKNQKTFKSQLVPRPQINTYVPLLEEKNSCWELEIGAGNGEFSYHRAFQNPQINIVAIEKTRHQFKKMDSENKPSNLWTLHTNAVWWVTHFVPENFLSSIFILYPNPYPKKKQFNLRWVNRPFMDFLLRRLKKNGILEIRTNEKFYFQETLDQMKKKFSYMKCHKVCRIQNQNPETVFERKYLSRMPCYKINFIKS